MKEYKVKQKDKEKNKEKDKEELKDLTRADRTAYKIARFFHRFLSNLAYKINKASLELHFLLYKIKFGERDDDIYIITYPKSGTTLVQMILYQMTTDGNMDFEHIYDVSPWIRNDAYVDIPPRDLPSPRIIKTHDPYKDFDHLVKGRFIYVYRDGKDVAVSKFHQEKNYNNPDLEFDEFMKKFLKPSKYGWFSYTKAWLENKKKLPILYLTYEELLNDFDNAIQKIIKYLQLDPQKIDFERVKERTRFEYMKQFPDKFGDQPPKKAKVYDQFLRKGVIGDSKNYLTSEHIEEYNKLLHKYLKNFVKEEK
ncbi:MAG: sulfotransferase domain-containing protein [Bacteroidales bacterium]|nr:sulfotransferase domain-containing protein [Bacteroidales bacterium]